MAAGKPPIFPKVRIIDGAKDFDLSPAQTYICGSAAPDATYENSDQSFTQDISPGVTFVAPDVTHIDTDGTPIPTPANNVFVCTPGVIPLGIYYFRPPIKSQNISYALHDDAWQVQNGIRNYLGPTNPVQFALLDHNATHPFTTLLNNNTFGNLFRFTGSTGGYQDINKDYFDKDGVATTEALAFPDDYVVDNYTGLGWTRFSQGNDSWNNHLVNADGLILAGFDDWFMPDYETIFSISNHDLTELSGVSSVFGYSPFNQVGSGIMSSTTAGDSTTTMMRTAAYDVGKISKAGNNPAFFYRNHFN